MQVLPNVEDEPLSDNHAANGQDGVGKVQALDIIESTQPFRREESHQVLNQE